MNGIGCSNHGEVCVLAHSAVRMFTGMFIIPCCRMLVAMAALATITLGAFAMPPVGGALPSVEHPDTETATNLSFTAWQPHLRYFTFSLSFNATPSNNVEMAFGTDRTTGTTGILPVENGSTGTTGILPVENGTTGTTGILPVGNGSTGTTGILPVEDGVLSLGENDLTVGWDCGTWFVEDGATGARVTAAPTGDCGAHELTVRVRIDHQGAVDDVRFLDNGVEVFAELAATKPHWLHSSGWNRLRLVGRGENVRAGERFFAQITPQGTTVRLR